jgi:hypothetical protein
MALSSVINALYGAIIVDKEIDLEETVYSPVSDC